MAIVSFPVLAVALVIQSASAAGADPRPALKDVSAIRIANYGSPSKLFNDREDVNSIVDELLQLRKKAWRRGDTKLSCYSTLMLLNGTRTVGLYRIRPDYVVERPMEKGQSSFTLVIGETDIPRIGKLLTEIPPAKGCQ